MGPKQERHNRKSGNPLIRSSKMKRPAGKKLEERGGLPKSFSEKFLGEKEALVQGKSLVKNL